MPVLAGGQRSWRPRMGRGEPGAALGLLMAAGGTCAAPVPRGSQAALCAAARAAGAGGRQGHSCGVGLGGAGTPDPARGRLLPPHVWGGVVPGCFAEPCLSLQPCSPFSWSPVLLGEFGFVF